MPPPSDWLLEVREQLAEALRIVADSLPLDDQDARLQRLREIANNVDPDFEVKS